MLNKQADFLFVYHITTNITKESCKKLHDFTNNQSELLTKVDNKTP